MPKPMSRPTTSRASFQRPRKIDPRAELAHIYDKNQAAQERAEERLTLPSTTTNEDGRPDTLHETFTKAYEWLEASPQQQATQRAAADLVQQVRDNAAKFGVTLDDKAAMEAAMKLEAEQAKQHPAHSGRTSTGLEISSGAVSQPCAA